MLLQFARFSRFSSIVTCSTKQRLPKKAVPNTVCPSKTPCLMRREIKRGNNRPAPYKPETGHVVTTDLVHHGISYLSCLSMSGQGKAQQNTP